MKKKPDKFCINCKYLDRKDIKLVDRDTYRCKKYPNETGIDPITGKDIILDSLSKHTNTVIPTNHKYEVCKNINIHGQCPKFKKVEYK